MVKCRGASCILHYFPMLRMRWTFHEWVRQILSGQGGFCCSWMVRKSPHRPIQWGFYWIAVVNLVLVQPGVGGVTIGSWVNWFSRLRWYSISVAWMPWWKTLLHYANGNVVVLVWARNIVVLGFSCSQSIRCRYCGIVGWFRSIWFCWWGWCTLFTPQYYSFYSMG